VIALTTIFGTEINVVVQPRDVERLYAGFPGAHGVTTMFMGSRGRKVIISGRIATAGTNYNAARINCQIAIDSIEPYLWSPATDYSFRGCVFYAVVFDQFRILPDRANKYFHWVSPGYVTADFLCFGRAIL